MRTYTAALQLVKDFVLSESFLLKRVKKIPRYKRGSISIRKMKINFIDSLSFFYQYKEIFEKKIYNFKSESSYPLIIDCGSNIGLSILFFKGIYPESRIIGFEPDPFIFSVLKENVVKNGYNDVELINKAVWIDETNLEFIPDGSDGGRIPLKKESVNKIISVPAISLSNFLEEDIDFLKIDIEGAEIVVLQSCKEKLNNVKNIFVEYHSFAHEKQSLHQLLEILSAADFRIYIAPISSNSQPFLRKKNISGMDMQLNIFAIRQT